MTSTGAGTSPLSWAHGFRSSWTRARSSTRPSSGATRASATSDRSARSCDPPTPTRRSCLAKRRRSPRRCGRSVGSRFTTTTEPWSCSRRESAASERLGILRDVLRDRVVLHEELAELLALGDQEAQRLVDLLGREVHRAHQVLRAGGDVDRVVLAGRREHVELPGLPAVEEPQAVGVELDVVQVHRPNRAAVLLDPRILDGVRVDPVQPLGEVAEGAVRFLLHAKDVLDLGVGKDALLDQQLPDLNAFCGQAALLRVGGESRPACYRVEVIACCCIGWKRRGLSGGKARRGERGGGIFRGGGEEGGSKEEEAEERREEVLIMRGLWFLFLCPA